MEYIEREALCYQLAKQATVDGQPRAIRRAAKIVADFPSADVVPVVRCGECKWSDNYGLDLLCQKHSGITKNKLGEDIHFVEWHSKNFFCSDGTRKGGDGE